MRDLTRRRVLRALLVTPATLALGCPAGAGVAAASRPPTPACADGDDDAPPTGSQTAGPFYKARSPERTSLREPGIGGTPLLLTGAVLTRACRPVPFALLDFWQADASGAYDNEGFRLRGHQRASPDGTFRLETVVPGLYPGRTRHLHVRVQAPDGGRLLTTQLYFPDEPRNARDGLFHPALCLALAASGGEPQARFDFVLDRT
jgi:protocatechuate 3,4-dioxygenase beta subunit